MNSNWSYSPETPNLDQIRRFFEPWDLEICWMTLKNNRAPLLVIIKLCASFHNYMWIQTGVTVWKRLSWVLTSVTLTFDLWPWPFAWTSLLSLVIPPENFMMIRWWEHSQKGVTDGHLRRIWSQLPWSKLHRILASSFLSSSYRVIFVFFIEDRQTDRQTDGLNQSYSCLVAAKKHYSLLMCL